MNGYATDYVIVFGMTEDRALGKYPVDIFSDGPACREGKRKRKNLIRLGIEQGQAYAWSRTRMGGWAVAQSPILGTTITLSRLRRKGYSSMLDHYLKSQPEIQ